MATPNVMREKIAELRKANGNTGTPEELILGIIRKMGSIPAAARWMGVADMTLLQWCHRHGIRSKLTYYIEADESCPTES